MPPRRRRAQELAAAEAVLAEQATHRSLRTRCAPVLPETVPEQSENQVKWQRSDTLALGGLLACFPLFFGRALLFQRFFFLDDIFVHFHPHWTFAGRHLADGVVPLWSPEIFCGFPVAANPQFGPWYLPNWICFSLLSPPNAINFSILSHFLLAALGTFLFARTSGLNSLGAFISAAGYAFSGFLLTYHVAPQGLFTLAWMPVVLWQVESAFQRPRHGLCHATWGGLALGFLLVSGHTQLALYELSLIGAYGVFRATQTRRPVALVTMGWLLLLGLGLFAVQLFPTLELFGQTSRAGAAGKAADLQPLSFVGLKHLVESAVPHFYGGMLTRHGFFYPPFVGVPILFLAAAGLLRREKSTVYFYLGALVLSLLVAAGPNTPFYGLMNAALPIAKVFKAPVRAIGIAVFSLAMLAGHACARGGRGSAGDGGGSARWSEILVPLGLGLAVAGALLWRMLSDQAAARLLLVPLGLAALPMEGIEWTLAHRTQELSLFCGLLILMAAGCVRVRKGRPAPAGVGPWHALLIVLSLWVFGRGVIGLTDRSIYEHRSPLLDVPGPEADEPFRIFHMDTEDDFLELTKMKWDGWPIRQDAAVSRASETLRENLSQVYGLHDFFGFSSLPLLRYQQFRYAKQDVNPIYAVYEVDVLPPYHFLERANCRLFVVGRRWRDESRLGPLLLRTPQFCAYRLADPMARARLVAVAVRATDPSQSLPHLLAASSPCVPVIEVAPEAGAPISALNWVRAGGDDEAANPRPIPVEVSAYAANSLTLAVPPTADEGGAIVLSDTWYPGWSAWLDGRRAPIFRADHVFRAVFRKGEREATFAFVPRSVKLGVFSLMMHLAAAAAVMGLLFVRTRLGA